jgi:hypothetical protein
MVDDNDDEALNDDELVFAKHSCDRDMWDEQMPRKVGLYHAFVRPHTKDSIEHKLFIVVSGSLPFLDEEFHRLWQDCNTFTMCEQLLESEELQWFRSATLRNHNRVAARVSDALGLPVRCFIDTEDPTGHRRSAHPTTMTMNSDIDIDLTTRRVHLVDGGFFLHKSSIVVLFEMHASEGFWLFTGPPDHASYNTYSSMFNFHKDMTCFPKKDVISTSDANAEFITENDMSDKNSCVDSIKKANAALKSKVDEMEKTLKTCTNFACSGL